METGGSRQREWIESVRTRMHSMSQRKLTVVESWPGGVDVLVDEAKAHGVHLLQLTDDRGEVLIAASSAPFKVLA